MHHISKIICNFAAEWLRKCSRSANATPHSDLGQRIASELAWPSLNRSRANENAAKTLCHALSEQSEIESLIIISIIMKKETIMRFISVPTAKGLCGARRVAMMLLMTMLTSLGAWAAIPTKNFPTASGGSGTLEDPYKISSTSDLNQLAEDVNNGITYQDVYFKLTQNITYSTSGLSEENSNFTPIGGRPGGGDYKLFSGHFDGDGKTISGIRIYRSGHSAADNYLGLFGIVEGTEGNLAEVKGVTLKNTRITGYQYCGGIVGSSIYAQITDCHVSDDVKIHSIDGYYVNSSTAMFHGGIVGSNAHHSEISGCTSEVTISKADAVTNFTCNGAIAGTNGGTIKDCLALPKAKITGNSYVGAIVGSNEEGILTSNAYTRFGVFGVGALNSQWGSDQEGAQFGKLTIKNRPSDWSGSASRSYTGGLSVYDKGIQYGTVSYSYEFNCYYTFTTMTDCWGITSGNDGSADHPYIITTTTGLDVLADQVAKNTNGYDQKYFELGKDITYSYTYAWDDTRNDNADQNNYTPIGIEIDPATFYSFSGYFDGKGHTVSGIRIYGKTGGHLNYCQGLFGRTYYDVKNVTLADARITGYEYVGGIVGESLGDITNCHVASNVAIRCSNSSYAHGGIVGEAFTNYGITISGCTSAASSSDNNYGGIAGKIQSKVTVKDCLFLGTSLTGSSYVGAIAGNNDGGTLTNNYHTASGVGGVNGADTDGAKFALGLSSVPSSYDIGAEGTTYGESTYTGITAYANGLKYNSKYYLPITPVVFSLADNDDNSTALSNNDGKAANVTLDGRTLYSDGDWNTLTLPFSLTAEEIAASPLADFTIKTLDGTLSSLDGEGKLTLTFEDASTIEAGKPYIVKSKADLVIKNKDDWDDFADAVTGGNTYEGKVVMLASNFDNSTNPVTTMAGFYSWVSSTATSKPFKGTFDGNGRTLTVNITSDEQYTAPFRSANGATIKNLTIAGNISVSKGLVGGMFAFAAGNNVISNCRISATITSSVNGDGTVGGFVSNIQGGNTSIENCLFDGSFVGTNTYRWSGFVGWVESRANNSHTGTAGSLSVKYSLFAPTTVSIKSHNDNKTVYRGPSFTQTLTKCYYKTALENSSSHQGIDASGMNNETLVDNDHLGSGWEISGGNVVPAMNNNIVNPVFESVIIDNTENPVNFAGGSFVGNYNPFAITDANRKSIVLLAAGNKLGYAKTDRTLNSFRAYFDIPSVAGAPAINSYELNFGDDDENTTGIIEVNTNNTNLTNKAEGVFDLQGRKVANPSKGLYIVNGRKVIIK